MTLAGTLELVRAGASCGTPVVVFSYLNPILRYGVDRFVRDADALGVAGVILTDLPAGSDPAVERSRPGEPARPDPAGRARPRVTTGWPRRWRTRRASSTWSRAWGSPARAARWPTTLADSVARVRRATPLPVAVGFGISTPAQAAIVARMADGVVVGSALVDALGARRRGGGAPLPRVAPGRRSTRPRDVA